MKRSKFLKLFFALSILFFVCLALFIPQKFVNAENLTWTREECQIKCAQTGEDIIKQLRRDEQKCVENKNKDCSYFQKEIDAVKSRFNIQEDPAGELDQKSAYCEGLGEQPKSTNEDLSRVYCYAPPMVVTLEVPVGQTKVTYGLIHYIQIIFQWGTKTVAVLAVLLIMFAGLQWLTSAGSQDAISKAKNRIKGAIIGLILVLISVGLLNFINPALVNLTGFQIKMVPTIAQGTSWCKDIAYDVASLKISNIDKTAENSKPSKDALKIGETINFQKPQETETNPQIGACGAEYEVVDKYSQCSGNACEKSNSTPVNCLRLSIQVFKCAGSQVYGLYSGQKLDESKFYLWAVYDEADNKASKKKAGTKYNMSWYKELQVNYPLLATLNRGGSFYFAFNNSEAKKNLEAEVAKSGIKLLGFFLEITLDDSLDADDHFAVDKKGDKFPNNYDADELIENWNNEAFANRLIKAKEVLDGWYLEIDASGWNK